MFAAVLTAVAVGLYPVKTSVIEHIPGLITPKPHSGVIVYPEGTPGQTFPFIVFGHGMGSGGSIMLPHYTELFKTVAERGFVIVAPESCPTEVCLSPFSVDMVTTLKACKENPGLHPALQTADFTRVGLFGHSQGAMATLRAAEHKDLNIKAAVSLHPCIDPFIRPKEIFVPTLFTSGTNDTVCQDYQTHLLFKDLPSATPTAYVNIVGANHEEPTSNGCAGNTTCPNRCDTPTADYFGCYLMNTTASCEKVKSICQQAFPLQNCEVRM
eukprot:TRINITY_DN12234_c0_g5_i1.p1 TRINITY_DN12234_c0_g5~~TRINITY_DN12234_c0_g5_i1.p1  ORF type:complete len:284 (+),score=47.28 TRINITY_DN12234_c0_g5_i1:47-853(+)